MESIRIDPTFNDRSSDIERLVDKRAKDILKADVCHQYREAVREALESGLIRKKTDDEIHNELQRKPWLKVNKTIRENEDRNNSTTDRIDNPD